VITLDADGQHLARRDAVRNDFFRAESTSARSHDSGTSHLSSMLAVGIERDHRNRSHASSAYANPS